MFEFIDERWRPSSLELSGSWNLTSKVPQASVSPAKFPRAAVSEDGRAGLAALSFAAEPYMSTELEQKLNSNSSLATVGGATLIATPIGAATAGDLLASGSLGSLGS